MGSLSLDTANVAAWLRASVHRENEDLRKNDAAMQSQINALQTIQANIALGAWIEFARVYLLEHFDYDPKNTYIGRLWSDLYSSMMNDKTIEREFYEVVETEFKLSKEQWLSLSKKFYPVDRGNAAHPPRPPADATLTLVPTAPEEFREALTCLIRNTAHLTLKPVDEEVGM